MLRRVIYSSQAAFPVNQRWLLDILHEARGYNSLDGITGMLLHDNGRFLQVIEGPPNAIADLIERLNCDDRHVKFEIHEDALVQTRLFPNWAMGLGDFADSTLSFLPGMLNETEGRDRLHQLADQLPKFASMLYKALSENN
ncbi:MAG: BLUF domain-containing protein [Mariniblastus sp.]|nr:BLUF domain-containing protein [Mariniblastus sp.]